MAPIKITGFDPDANEKPEPEPSPIRRRNSSDAPRQRPEPPPREVRKPVDASTAEHLRIKYGMTNVKFSELAPKKSGSRSSMKSGASHRYAGPRLSLEPEKVQVPGAPAAPAAGPDQSESSAEASPPPEDADPDGQ